MTEAGYSILVVCLIASSIAANTLASQAAFGKLVQEPSHLNYNRQVQQYQTAYYTNHFQGDTTNIVPGTYITSEWDNNKFQFSLIGFTSTCASHLVLISLLNAGRNSLVPKKLCVAVGTPLTNMHASSYLINFV